MLRSVVKRRRCIIHRKPTPKRTTVYFPIVRRNYSDRSEFISDETWEKIQKISREARPEGAPIDNSVDELGSKKMTGYLGGRKMVFLSGMQKRPVRKWYSKITAEVDAEADKWTVHLDGRNVLTRTDRGLFVPSEEAAILLASEFAEQGDMVNPASMPFLDLVCRSIDDMPKYRPHYYKELIDFLICDHVCIREAAPEKKEHGLQKTLHQPIVDAFQEKMGLKLDVSDQNFILEHPKQTVSTIEVLLDSMDNITFFGFHQLAHSVKSVVTAFCLWHDLITVEHAFESTLLEETIQEQLHGTVEGTHDLKAAQLKMDIVCALLFLQSTGYIAPDKTTISLLGDCVALRQSQLKEEWDKVKDMKTGMYETWKSHLQAGATTTESKQKLEPFLRLIEARADEEISEAEMTIYRNSKALAAHEKANTEEKSRNRKQT